MSTPFRLTLTLATPFVMGARRTTLDGLLSAAVFRERGLMGMDTAPYIPLEREHGIFKGSSLFCHPGYTHVEKTVFMRLGLQNDRGPGLFAPFKRGGKYAHIDQVRGEYKANMSKYQAINSREVYFWGVGDPERACSLIQTFIPGIGKRSGAGSGEIIDVRYDLEESQSCAWLSVKEEPMRPMPLWLWSQITGNRPAPVVQHAVDLPYWDSDTVEAVIPLGMCI